MAPEVKTAKNSKLPKLPENCFEPVGKGGWPPISIWIMQIKRLLITTTKRHCREKGHAEGGYEYRPLVRGFNI
jgi:hypothetical protein